MKITRVNGFVWPIKVSCETCDIDLEVNLPTDMLRHTEYGYFEKDGLLVHGIRRRYVTVACPCCKTEQEIEGSKIPTLFYRNIPLASGECPFFG